MSPNMFLVVPYEVFGVPNKYGEFQKIGDIPLF